MFKSDENTGGMKKKILQRCENNYYFNGQILTDLEKRVQFWRIETLSKRNETVKQTSHKDSFQLKKSRNTLFDDSG